MNGQDNIQGVVRGCTDNCKILVPLVPLFTTFFSMRPTFPFRWYAYTFKNDEVTAERRRAAISTAGGLTHIVRSTCLAVHMLASVSRCRNLQLLSFALNRPEPRS